MITLRPPDGRVFVEIEKKLHKHTDCIIKKVGKDSDFTEGQRVCIIGRLEKTETQGIELYSARAEDIAFIYE